MPISAVREGKSQLRGKISFGTQSTSITKARLLSSTTIQNPETESKALQKTAIKLSKALKSLRGEKVSLNNITKIIQIKIKAMRNNSVQKKACLKSQSSSTKAK